MTNEQYNLYKIYFFDDSTEDKEQQIAIVGATTQNNAIIWFKDVCKGKGMRPVVLCIVVTDHPVYFCLSDLIMKKIKPHITTYCTFCKLLGQEKVKAVWRISYDYYKNTACDVHKEFLADMEIKRYKINNKDYSEGDYQSWLKL